MKVFIIGAGFSKAAGYPLGSEMLTELGEFVERNSNFVHLGNFWSGFDSWRKSQTDTGVLELIDTGNVEFVITYLDLLAHAEDFKRMQYFKKEKQLEESEVNKLIYERGRRLEETKEFFLKVSIARESLKRLLVEYFEHKHCEGREEAKGEYIKDFCKNFVNQGDVFITFNYDALLERALYSLCRWSPSDGYGFNVDFKEIEQWKKHEPAALGESAVKVLKLHGSVGWYINNSNNKIFLNRGRFLQNFIPGIRDNAELDYPPDQNDIPVVMEPSFIKPIEQKELLNIWDEARRMLERAKEVFILGYSMPQADASAQNLIVHSLRANAGQQKITIVNPDLEILGRYEELLGFQVEKQRAKVEEWVHSMVAN